MSLRCRLGLPAVDVVVVGFMWCAIFECRVKPLAIVPEFDVLHNITAGVFQGRVLRPIDPFDFQRGIEDSARALS